MFWLEEREKKGRPYIILSLFPSLPLSLPPSLTPPSLSLPLAPPSLSLSPSLSLAQINNTDCIGKRPTRLTTVIKRNGHNQGTILSCFLYNISNSSCSEVSIGAVNGSVWSVTVNISEYLLSRQHYTAEMVFDNEAGNASETVRTFSELSLNISQLICYICNNNSFIIDTGSDSFNMFILLYL